MRFVRACAIATVVFATWAMIAGGISAGMSKTGGGRWEGLSAIAAVSAAGLCLIGGLAGTGWLTYTDKRKLDLKPDYALIASMEREIYGAAFRHDGAPERSFRSGGVIPGPRG